MHVTPTPRTGGVAVLIAVAAGWTLVHSAILVPEKFFWLILAVVVVATFSIWDDWKGLSPATRLVAHLIAASSALQWGIAPQSIQLPSAYLALEPMVGTLLALVFLIWTINLYNFMDGLNGLAGGMGVFGFGFFAVLGFLAGAPDFALLAAVVAAASAGFLVFNFGNARIFMGDVGSAPLGLLMGAFMLWAERAEIFPLWTGVVVFSPFFVDATVTLVRRALRGEPVWKPHKTHYYQQLVARGWTHRRVALTEYGLMVVCGVLAAYALRLSSHGQWLVILALATIYASVIYIFERR